MELLWNVLPMFLYFKRCLPSSLNAFAQKSLHSKQTDDLIRVVLRSCVLKSCCLNANCFLVWNETV